MARGVQFEDALVRGLCGAGARVIGDTPGASAGPLRGLAQLVRAINAAVADAGDEQVLFYAYEPVLAAPSAYLRKRWGIPAEHTVRFGAMRPDILRVSLVRGTPPQRSKAAGGPALETPHAVRVQVVDIKASSSLKSSHQIQIAFYRIGLRGILEKAGLAEHILLDREGEVWRPSDSSDKFDVPLAELFLDSYMRRHWHLFTEPPANAPLSLSTAARLPDLESLDEKFIVRGRTAESIAPSTVLAYSDVAAEAEWNLWRFVVLIEHGLNSLLALMSFLRICLALAVCLVVNRWHSVLFDLQLTYRFRCTVVVRAASTFQCAESRRSGTGTKTLCRTSP